MSSTFHIEIALGNAAMCQQEDVAEALRDLGDRLMQSDEQQGPIRDENGNRVGSFWYEQEEAV